jgi:hypothetical protein
MKVIYNNIIPFPGFKAINIFGVVFARKGSFLSEEQKVHEAIHTIQMRELLYIGFYIFYFLEWVIKLFLYKDAYSNISFEREAYSNQEDVEYLTKRKRYAWFKLI